MSLQAPYFTIGLPTRNRGELAEQAIRCVLSQTFQDFELIVADSDETDDTLNRLKKLPDPRIRYYKTRGKSGPDNFQFCVDQARGEYFLLLTDRLLLRPHALEVLYQNSEQCRHPAMRYHFDTFDDRGKLPKVWSPEYCTGENKLFNAEEVLSQFVGGVGNEYFYRIVPTPQYSAIHHSVFDKIRGPGNRPIFAPLIPDMWCIFAQLSCYEAPMLNIGQSLSVFIIRDGVYFSLLLKKKSATHFLREICKCDELAMSHVPVKSPTIDNMIYNDYYRAQKIYGGRLLDYSLPWATYFVGVHRNLQDSMKAGVNMRTDFRQWHKALAMQPPDVQEQVWKRLGPGKKYTKLETARLLKKVRSILGIKHLENGLRLARRRKSKPVAPFKTVIEYLNYTAVKVPT